jgi:hypothetical protein
MTPEAAARIEARKHRIHRMRRGVIAASLSTFALAFGLVAFDGSRGATDSSSHASAVTQSTNTTTSTQQDNGPAPVATHAS